MDIEQYNIDKKTICYVVKGKLNANVVLNNKDDILHSMPESMNVVVDCSQMSHIDSSGLGMLVQMLQKTKQNSTKIVLVGINNSVKIVFDITKVSKIFNIVPTVDDAMKMLYPH